MKECLKNQEGKMQRKRELPGSMSVWLLFPEVSARKNTKESFEGKRNSYNGPLQDSRTFLSSCLC